jgi:DNA-binding NarL/FixJ family response regulator
MIKVLIADDQALLRGAFRTMLETEPDMQVVGEAGTGREAVDEARLRKPDVILMDIRMPGIDGIEATRQLQGSGSASRVLILTTFDLDEYVYEAMRAGASGFMLKNSPPDQLASAIRTIAAGEALLAPTVTRRLIEEYVTRPRPGSAVPSELAELTERELAVLKLIARGLSNAEIAAELVVSEATVRTHVNRVLTKLSVRDRTQATVLAYESGLVTPGAAS